MQKRKAGGSPTIVEVRKHMKSGPAASNTSEPSGSKKQSQRSKGSLAGEGASGGSGHKAKSGPSESTEALKHRRLSTGGSINETMGTQMEQRGPVASLGSTGVPKDKGVGTGAGAWTPTPTSSRRPEVIATYTTMLLEVHMFANIDMQAWPTHQQC
jgi:hypothetical protein